MLNIIELEKQWMRYKIKYYLPHFIIFISTLIISTILFIFIKYDNNSNNDTNSSVATIMPVQKVVTPPLAVKEIVPTPKKELTSSKEQLTLQPSLNFLNDIKYSSRPYVETPKVHHHKVVQTQKRVKPKVVAVVAPTPQKVSKISIKREETNQDLQIIIKRFKQSNNPDLSLFIAKKYYEQKNYKQAYNYALITNRIDSTIDESWIVFSKALVKLGKKEFAIKVLQDYTQNSQSSTANILLSDIKSGKFR